MHYCEQLHALNGFEPWNAVTNAAFIAAAVVAWRVFRHAGLQAHAEARGLVGLTAAIGLGSFAWHATGAGWAQLADVLPILCFVLLFLTSALTQLFGCPRRVAALACAALIGTAGTATALAGHALNGSIAYLPVWGGLLALTVLAAARRSPMRRALAFATLLLAVSLVFRTFDLGLCAATGGIGTHFLWHLCNALLLAHLMAMFARHHPARLAPH